jgi:hypothetical protein
MCYLNFIVTTIVFGFRERVMAEAFKILESESLIMMMLLLTIDHFMEAKFSKA